MALQLQCPSSDGSIEQLDIHILVRDCPTLVARFWIQNCCDPGVMHRKATKKISTGENELRPERQIVYRLQAEICRVLGHPERLAIIDLLQSGEKLTAELRCRLGISKVNLSRHLTLLKQVGLVESRLQGREAAYRLAFREIGVACSSIRDVLALRLLQSARLAKTASLRDPHRHSPFDAQHEAPDAISEG